MNRTARVDRRENAQRDVPAVISLLVIGFAFIYLCWDSVYTVQPHERGVVFRFGKYLNTVEPGLNTKIPFVDEVALVDVKEHEQRLPFDEVPSDNYRGSHEEDQSLMLTGDLNAAVVEWTIQWRVVDPAKFIVTLNPTMIDGFVRDVSRTVMHQVIGDYSIDEVLTAKRTEVGVVARDLLQEQLDQFGSGIQITGLQMQRITPPALVKPAFDEVNASVQRRDQLINEANALRNELIPKAEAQRDKLIREAEGYAARREAETQGEIAALLEQYKAYKEAPEITRQRLYLETLQDILSNSGPKTVIDHDIKGLVPLLNLPGMDTPTATTQEGE